MWHDLNFCGNVSWELEGELAGMNWESVSNVVFDLFPLVRHTPWSHVTFFVFSSFQFSGVFKMISMFHVLPPARRRPY